MVFILFLWLSLVINHDIMTSVFIIKEFFVIDFSNKTIFKLEAIDNTEGEKALSHLLIDKETVLYSFKSMRDMVIFTNKRIVTINVQGITGKKKDFTTLPYSKIQAFSVETAGTFDIDSEVDLWFSGLGQIRLDFSTKIDITGLCKMISSHVL
jgi:hypothetical protein